MGNDKLIKLEPSIISIGSNIMVQKKPPTLVTRPRCGEKTRLNLAAILSPHRHPIPQGICRVE